MKKGERKKLNSNLKKQLLIAMLILFLVIIIIFGAKIYLYIKIFLGNDVVISLSENKNTFFINNGESDKVEFTIRSSSNILCTTECEYTFVELNNKRIVAKETFSLKPEISVKKEFTLFADGSGEGQDIYRLNLECHAIYTQFCPSEKKPTIRSPLIIVNRELNEKEFNDKNTSKNNIIEMIRELNEGSNIILSLNKTFNETDKIIINDEYINVANLENSLINEQNLSYLKEYWDQQSFSKLYSETEKTKKNILGISSEVKKLNSSVSNNISEFNLIINNCKGFYSNISYFKIKKDYVANQSKIEELGSLIDNFNIFIDRLNNQSTINSKYEYYKNFSEKIIPFIKLMNNEITPNINQNLSDFKLNNLNEVNLIEIIINYTNATYFSFNLDDPKKSCCLFGKCEFCCEDEICKDDPNKYPIVFLHGHSFSKGYSAESSLDSFDEMQIKLEGDNYLNAGTITLYSEVNETKGLWSLINYPLTLRTSYYFDFLKDPNNPAVIQTKSENIDSYAVRLKEIISKVKEKTGRKKVILITHSMGGLVARRYVQLFGTEDVDKMILIAAPNKGVIGTAAEYCDLFGETLECNDMKSGSLFMSKLNNGDTINMPIYNIVGLGCDTDGYDGDGIVTKDNAVLDGAENIFVQGHCDSLNKFHTNIVNIDMYPEVYNQVIKILKNESV
jgi:hypothetical protein